MRGFPTEMTTLLRTPKNSARDFALCYCWRISPKRGAERGCGSFSSNSVCGRPQEGSSICATSSHSLRSLRRGLTVRSAFALRIVSQHHNQPTKPSGRKPSMSVQALNLPSAPPLQHPHRFAGIRRHVVGPPRPPRGSPEAQLHRYAAASPAPRRWSTGAASSFIRPSRVLPTSSARRRRRTTPSSASTR